MVNRMHELMVFLEHMDITAKLYLDIMIKYTEKILTQPALNKYF